MNEMMKDGKKKHRKLLITVMCVCSVLVLLLLGTAVDTFWGNRYVVNWLGGIFIPINHESVDDIVMMPSDLTEEEQKKAVTVPKLKNDSNIINILLIGEESINMATGQLDTQARGRSDCNIVLSINRKNKTCKMVSFLRDTYVQIPGYRASKLNAAYQYGGGPLLQQTIQLNFNVITDGYIRVNFGDFQKIVNLLGGVDIELTAKEARYLNTTNYVSRKKNRTLKAGKNHMNGNQVVGYTRVRKQATDSDEHDDWGRTYRQRKVIQAIFEKYKNKSMAELVPLANKLLPFATTDMKTDELLALLGEFMELKIKKIDTLSVPHPGGYTPNGGGISGALLPNYTTLNKEIADFFDNKETAKVATPTPIPTSAKKKANKASSSKKSSSATATPVPLY